MGNDERVFSGGVPTDMELNFLHKKIGVPKVGRFISYDEVEEIIKCGWKSWRFRTITTRWRNILEREHSVFLKAVTGQGFRALNASGRVAVASDKLDSGKRMIGRAVSIAVKTDAKALKPEEKRVCDHVRRFGQLVQQYAATAPKKIKYPENTVAQMPR